MNIDPDQRVTTIGEMEITMPCQETIFFNMTREKCDWLKKEYPDKDWIYCWDNVVSVGPTYYNICFRKPIMKGK